MSQGIADLAAAGMGSGAAAGPKNPAQRARPKSQNACVSCPRGHPSGGAPAKPACCRTTAPAGRALPILLAILALLGQPDAARAQEIRVLIQQSPLAGSQYYALSTVWREIRVGNRLTLVREPGNRHDPDAIRVEWRGQKLGYVPRAENRALAAALDAGERLSARVSSVGDSKNPWQRVAFEVFAEL